MSSGIPRFRTGALLGFGLCFVLCPCLGQTRVQAQTQSAAPAAQASHWSRTVIDADLPGGYQVEIADVNADGLPDVIALGGGTCAWYQNPSWTKRIVSTPKDTPGIISSATADLDGDGLAEIAIAHDFNLNSPLSGQLVLARQNPDASRWRFEKIAALGSIHRVRIADFDHDGRPDILAAPIVGPAAAPPAYDQAPAPLTLYRRDPAANVWKPTVIASRYIMHAIDVVKQDNVIAVLTADQEGAARIQYHPRASGAPWLLTPLFPGAPGAAPKRGCSEIHAGKLKSTGDARFYATVEFWHGPTVVTWTPPNPTDPPAPGKSAYQRTVVDPDLGEGHALWVADIDKDGDDEIFAGDRGPLNRVTGYDWNRTHRRWDRFVLDPAVAAQDLRGGDLDGDLSPDFVAVGGKTHNVVWYRYKGPVASE